MTHILRNPWSLLLSPLVVLLSLLALPAQAADVIGLQLVDSVRSGRTSFDYTYRITVGNVQMPLAAAQATLQAAGPGTTIVDGIVSLGDLAASSTTLSTDTFTIRQDRTRPFNAAALTWTITGVAPNAPAAMQVQLSEPFVAPDGSVTVTPVLRNRNGDVIEDNTAQFTVSVAPVGAVIGNPPVVAGLTVRFPKLVKQLLAQNASIDPEGLYADTNPSDPNFGLETGGTYRVTVRLAGSMLSSSADVNVLPSGTAGITFKVGQYASTLGNALEQAQDAVLNRDAALLAQARSALQTTRANPDFSLTVLGTTNALAPADGYVPTLAQLSARGLVAGPQDAQYVAALAVVLQRIREARASVEALSASALTPESLDALVASVAAYQQALQTLQTYRLSAYGTVQQQAAIQQQIAVELPQLLDAIKNQSSALLAVVTVAGAPAPTLAGLAHLDFQQLAHTSPLAMYAGTRPVQWSTLFTFWSTAFSAFTDLSGAARTNLWELSISLTNTLINVMAADIINQSNPGLFSISYVYASSSTAAMCPDYRPTRIIGSGLGTNAGAYRVAVVGCIQSDALARIITLSVPSNPAAYIRMFNRIVSLSQSLATTGGAAAVEVPDYIASDDIGFDEYMLYFGNGWPRVNQSRLPCAGLVIVMDMERGGLQAFTPLALPRCG